MAFSKSIDTPSGYPATYTKLGRYNINRLSKKARGEFLFYKDKATADKKGSDTVCRQIAELLLDGDSFTRWFGPAAIGKAVADGLTTDDPAILYRAARAEGLVCDMGDVIYYPKRNPDDKTELARPNGFRDVFAGATDV